MTAATGTGRRERTKAANRAAILAAARAVFAQSGYGAASVRDIVRGTELASGTFYNYFPDKESIFRALVLEFAAEARRRVRAARLAADGPEAFVRDAYRAYFALVAEDPGMAELMRRNTGAVRQLFGDVAMPAVTDELVEDLRAAIARGDLPAVDVEYCAHAMAAVGLELGARLIERDPPDVEGATRFATDLFLGGMAVSGRR